MFNDKYGLTQAVLDGRKTMTRREIPVSIINEFGHNKFSDKSAELIQNSLYQVGEVVAIAQSYDVVDDILPYRMWSIETYRQIQNTPGWKNKMFVKADLMPHHIRITNIRVERLQDISDYDCLREGIIPDGYFLYTFGKLGDNKSYETPKTAFAALIDKVSGKGTWESNPWVFVYEFEKVD